MRLVYEETQKEVQVGDVCETFGGEWVKVMHFKPPHKPGSTGKVSVLDMDPESTSCKNNHQIEYGVGVIKARWIEREDQEPFERKVINMPTLTTRINTPDGANIARLIENGDDYKNALSYCDGIIEIWERIRIEILNATSKNSQSKEKEVSH